MHKTSRFRLQGDEVKRMRLRLVTEKSAFGACAMTAARKRANELEIVQPGSEEARVIEEELEILSNVQRALAEESFKVRLMLNTIKSLFHSETKYLKPTSKISRRLWLKCIDYKP